MSLLRTAARLAVSRALLTDPVIANICGDRVFDSRISVLQPQEMKPVVILTTEESGGDVLRVNNGGPPFDERAKLAFEIAMRSVEFDEAGEHIGFGTAVTDKELEAQLDLLEERIRWIVGAGTSTESRLVRKVVRRMTRYESERFATDDANEKLAMRLMSAHVQLINDTLDARIVPTGPYAALPQQLRDVCGAMPDGSSQQGVCRVLAAAFPTPTPAPILQTAAVNPAGTTTPVPDDPVPAQTFTLSEAP